MFSISINIRKFIFSNSRTIYKYEYSETEKRGLKLRILNITIGFVSLLILLLVTTNHALNVTKAEVSPQSQVDFLPYTLSIDKLFYSTPSMSSQVSLLPWENDKKFQMKQVKKKY